jgi:hypothetical protein
MAYSEKVLDHQQTRATSARWMLKIQMSVPAFGCSGLRGCDAPADQGQRVGGY